LSGLACANFAKTSGRGQATGVSLVKGAADYLLQVKALIAVNPQVVHWTVICEEAQGDMGLFRYRLGLRDGGLLKMLECTVETDGKSCGREVK